jgi:predicted Zn-dependent protease
MKSHVRQLSLLIGAFSLVATSLASAQLVVSEREAIRQARTEWLMMKKHTPVYGDERVQLYVQCIANDLISTLDDEWQDLSWEVMVWDVDEINAFVLPGGKISVYSGILKVADTPDALAAVLGHEIAHMTEGHTMERLRAEQRSTAVAILGSAATGIPQDYWKMGAAFGVNLPFARRQESEADRVGLEYMARAGFDPRAGLQLWQNMAAASQERNKPPIWMSTHPREDDRMYDMVPLIAPNLKIYNEAQDAGHIPNCYPR